MEKKMSYRVYKNRFSDCKTLNDYDKKKRTITVLISDDDYRIKRSPKADSKIWKSYGNEWRLKLKDNQMGSSSHSVRKCEGGYYAIRNNSCKIFESREDAFNWVLQNNIN